MLELIKRDKAGCMIAREVIEDNTLKAISEVCLQGLKVDVGAYDMMTDLLHTICNMMELKHLKE